MGKEKHAPDYRGLGWLRECRRAALALIFRDLAGRGVPAVPAAFER